MPEEVVRAMLTRLAEIQEAQGWSTSRLAREIGISPSYLGRLKRGERGDHLRLDTAMKMVARFPELAVFLTDVSPTITNPETEGEGQP